MIVINIIGITRKTPVAAPVISCRKVSIGVRPSMRTMWTPIKAMSGKTRHMPSVAMTRPAATGVW